MADSAATRIVLIRHGESQVTVDQVVGGHEGCTGLSDEGRAQARRLRDRLERTGELADAAALYASVMPRAIETAEIIAPAVGKGSLDIVQECGVCEIHPGEGDGLTWAEFDARFGRPKLTQADRFREWAPGAESWAHFIARVGTALVEIAGRHEGELAVVACHGGVVEASFIAFGGMPMDKPFDLFVTNTSLTEWAASRDGRWRLERYNDAAHLEGA